MTSLALAALLSGITATAAAREAPPLAEVTVTATRRQQPLLDYAGSVTRIDAGTVALVGATHHAELLNRIPGVFIQAASGQESLTAIRSPVLTGAGSCGEFLVLEDGYPIRPVGFCNVNEMFEVDTGQARSVEVVRGPGSALYGANAVHGIINVLNPLPADLPSLGLGLELGSYDYTSARLAASGRLAGAASGLAGVVTHYGGWRDHSALDEQKLVTSLVHDGETGRLILRLNGTHLDQQTASYILGKDAYKDRAIARSNSNPESYRRAQSLRGTANFSRDLGDAGHFDLSLVLRTSKMQFVQHFLLGEPIEKNGQDSVEALMSRTFPTGSGSLIAGLDVELASGFLVQVQDQPTTGGSPAANAIRPAGLQYDYDVRSRLVAPYLQWQQPLSRQLTLTAGLRQEWLHYRYDNRMLVGDTDANGVPCPGGCLYSRPADRSDQFANAGPRLGLDWRLSPTSSLWTLVSRGFRPPEATELYRLQRGQQVADLRSESIEGIETGFRHLGERLSAELTFFWMDKRNVILRDSYGFNVSDGRTRHRGVEFGFGAELGAGWSLAGSGTLARHTYEFSGGIEQGEQVTRGNDVDTAPRQLYSLRLGYRRGGWAGELEWQHVGPYWVNAANTARYPGHDLLNLRLRMAATARLAATLRITNLANVAYADRADYAFGNYRYFPGRPRSVFLEFDWRHD